MQEVRFDRLSAGASSPILHGVIGEKQMTKHTYRMASAEELYALEMQARRLRSQAVANALRNGVKAVRSYFARPASAPRGRMVRHA
jgi:hypothetical protein